MVLHCFILLQLPKDIVGPMTPIGTVGNDALFVSTDYKPGLGTECTLYLVFERQHLGRVLEKQKFDVGSSNGLGFVSLNRLNDNGRTLIFASVSDQRSQSFLLDYDGKAVKILYKNAVGRVAASPAFDDRGRAIIVEYWPKNQYESVFHKKKEAYKTGPRAGTIKRIVVIKS